MISIVIQGPISSRSFNCTNNILKLINEYAAHKMVDKVILSTWTSKDEKFMQNDKIVFLENVLPDFKDYMNRYKQFYSVFIGTTYIKNNTTSKYILKLRTDQYIDSAIIDYTLQFLENSNFDKNNELDQENFIISSHSYNCIPYFIGDFYFAGTVNDILKYTGTYNKYLNFCHQWLPEADIVIKYLRTSKSMAKKVPNRLYNIRTRREIGKQELLNWVDIYTHYFSIYPKRFFDLLIWRGVSYSNNKHDYLEQWNTAKLHYDSYLWQPDNSKVVLKTRIKDLSQFFIRAIKYYVINFSFQRALFFKNKHS